MAQAMLAPGPTSPFDLDANDDSLPLLQAMQARHGDVHCLPSATRGNESLVLHDPDAIRRVLLANRNNYVKGAGLERVRMLLGNGLIVSDGPFWARQRRLVQPAFTGQMVRGFAPLIERLNGSLVERWQAHALSGQPLDITHELSAVSLEIVLRALFSTDFDRLVEAEGESPFDLLTRETRRDLAFAARFRALTRFVREMIAARRREGRVETDFLSMMMQARDKESGEAMPDRALLDEAMTLIVAGHETTASTLNWTWYLLSQHPQIEARLLASLGPQAPGLTDPFEGAPEPADAAAGLPQGSSYAERVVQEALRLYPPVWLFSRRALQDDTLAGYHVAAGSDIFICPYLLHRHPAHWQRPDEFDPDRFTPGAVAGRHRFVYLPFSAGPRFCIGAGFAMAEMAEHLRQVVHHFRLAYAGPMPPEAEFQINLRTRHNLQMRLLPR